MEQTTPQTATVLSPENLLKHWQGHRDLTRRIIVAFPETEFFNFSIGGMRTFSAMTMELLAIAAPGLRELVGEQPKSLNERMEHGNKKEAILTAWDETTEEINRLFPQISAERFNERVKLFGQYENSVWAQLLYFIDNEIHHRAQGYVYLRSLGVEPPAFWDRP